MYIIDTKEKLSDIVKKADVMVLKHSTRCPVSASAKSAFDRFMDSCDEKLKFGIIDVIRNRDVSQEIERVTGVMHQSPQVILFRSGKAVWTASHWEITTQSLEESLDRK